MRLNKKGDTLVEVLLATVVLSVVLAGAYNLTNTATRINQQAYERTRVSNYLQQQAEILRSARDATDPIWIDIITNRTQNSLSAIDCKNRVDLSTLETDYNNGFYLINSLDPLNPGFEYASSPNIPALESLFYVWVEAYDPGGPSGPVPDASYVDLRISACWEGIGQSEKQQSGIVIRLERTSYE